MRVLILGCGYTGSVLRRHLESSTDKPSILRTTRRSSFDLNNPDSWASLVPTDNVPFDHVYWLFPAEPLTTVETFFSFFRPYMKRLVVVGSTSAFKVLEAGLRVNEDSLLDLEIPRVAGEVFLREQGAVIVRAAGIYGPDRDPRRWLAKGLIKAGHSYLNLIHVEDLARMLIAASQAKPGTQWIASDNHPLRWNEIVDHLQLVVPESYRRNVEKPDSKYIDSSRSWQESHLLPRYKNIFEGIDSFCESFDKSSAE